MHTFTSLTHFIHFVGNQKFQIHSQSSHFSQIRTNSHSNTLSLDLQSSIVQMRLEGSKIRVYIDIIGKGKLKGHQINGSLPLGNIIVHLTLPHLIPHFDNFIGGWITLDCLIGLRWGLENKLLRHIRREPPLSHGNTIGFR